MDTKKSTLLTRRRFLHGATALGLLAGLERVVPSYAWQNTEDRAPERVRTDLETIELLIRQEQFRIAGRDATAITLNGSVPGPLLRLREGRTITLRVTNQLEEDTSIHWHGLILPPDMDGVPGVSFPGIKPG